MRLRGREEGAKEEETRGDNEEENEMLAREGRERRKKRIGNGLCIIHS